MKQKFLLWLMALVVGVANLSAQQTYTLQGMVKDMAGEPLIGASVKIKNSPNGVVTDIEGRFKINVKNGDVIQFSYVGYTPQEVKLTGQNDLEVVLKENSEVLEDVVVVGYGTMRKKDLTGSVVQIKPDKIATESPKTVQDILRGTPGLRIGLSTSAKGGGGINIRGTRSVSGTSTSDPLLILDGVPFYGELSEINPQDIGQIDILKDASAAAVYGAKAANGVIIITTKKGTIGKPVISARINLGLILKALSAKYGILMNICSIVRTGIRLLLMALMKMATTGHIMHVIVKGIWRHHSDTMIDLTVCLPEWI